MRKPNFVTFGLIWYVAAAASFYNYVDTLDPAALVKTGLFMLFGVIYFHLNRREREREKQKKTAQKNLFIRSMLKEPKERPRGTQEETERKKQ